MRARKDTKWKPVMISNVRYYVTSTGYVLGHGDLPRYISSSHSIVCLTKDYHRNASYNDNLCLFRALSFHKYGEALYKQSPKFEAQVRKFYIEFNTYMTQDFHCGVEINYMPDFEKCFETNVNIFSLKEDGTVIPVFKSIKRFDDTMNLNLFENHLSYVKNFKSIFKKV